VSTTAIIITNNDFLLLPLQGRYKKISPGEPGEKYVDGLVSTGNKFPNTILIRIFPK
jgi:hypothetical protein